MAITQVNDQNFKQIIEQNHLVLVDFWAPWCGPCRILAPILDQLDRESEGNLTIAKVNVDENPITASQFRIMSIPTMKLFRNGVEQTTLVGAQPLEKLKAIIQQYM